MQKYKKKFRTTLCIKIFCTFVSMKAIQGPLFRAIVAIVVGALLIKYREQTLHWMTVAIGALFFLSGAISCISYWMSRNRTLQAMDQYQADGTIEKPRMPIFPIVGVGSLILGGILTFMPDTFISGVAIILSAILILGALNQLVSLGQARRYSRIPVLYWVFPLVTLVVGILVLVDPKGMFSAPLFVIGWCMVFYGVVECLNALKIFQMRRTYEKAEEARIVQGMNMTAGGDVEDAVIVEEEK